MRSFGTEERETQYPILPQPTIYDYILFRGSDIKDIRVVNNVTIPNDPAIVQLHLPPQQNQMPPQPPQGFQPGYGPMGPPRPPPQMNPPFMQSGGLFMQQQQQQQQSSNINQDINNSNQANSSGSTAPLSSAAPGGPSSINKPKSSELNINLSHDSSSTSSTNQAQQNNSNNNKNQQQSSQQQKQSHMQKTSSERIKDDGNFTLWFFHLFILFQILFFNQLQNADNLTLPAVTRS